MYTRIVIEFPSNILLSVMKLGSAINVQLAISFCAKLPINTNSNYVTDVRYDLKVSRLWHDYRHNY